MVRGQLEGWPRRREGMSTTTCRHFATCQNTGHSAKDIVYRVPKKCILGKQHCIPSMPEIHSAKREKRRVWGELVRVWSPLLPSELTRSVMCGRELSCTWMLDFKENQGAILLYMYCVGANGHTRKRAWYSLRFPGPNTTDM